MKDARRQRFLAWYAKHYADDAAGRKKFMEDSGARGEKSFTKGRVSQLFDERQPFGETAARNLAVRFGLSDDFFERDGDQAQAASPSPSPGRDLTELHEGEYDLLSAFRMLSPELRKQYLHDMAADAVEAHSIEEKVLGRLREIAENGPARRTFTAPISDAPGPRGIGKSKVKR